MRNADRPGAVVHSRFRQGHAQNAAATGTYAKAVLSGSLPIVRGIEFSDEDAATGWVIERLMCDFGFSGERADRAVRGKREPLIARAALIAKADPEKLVLDRDRFVVPETQRPIVRTIAARFDRHLHDDTAKHSSAV